jgi:hypothetical protein
MGADGFLNFWVSFCEENPKWRFLLATMKSLTNFDNPSNNHIQWAAQNINVTGHVCYLT